MIGSANAGLEQTTVGDWRANAFQMAWVWCGTLAPMPAKAKTISPRP